MAAPTPTARGTPAGLKLRDGFSSKITFAAVPTVSFWEKSVSPPGIDGGPKIDQTTMFNTMRTTAAAQSLYEVTDGSMKVAYDPNVYNTIINTLINYHTTITQTWRDGSTLADFGYLQSFKPDALERGKQPEATVTFVFIGQDSSGTEYAPVITSVSGT